MSNEAVRLARTKKNDEFYTLYEDVEKELQHYKNFLINKKVYLCCDDTSSAFWKYFYNNFDSLQLTSLAASTLDGKYFYTDGEINLTHTIETGDIRSDSIKSYILSSCDIIITNPPFSILKEFLIFLTDTHKDFILIGNQNVIGAATIFPLVKDGKIKIGYTHPKHFNSPEGEVTFGNILWLTSLPIDKDKPSINLTKEYDPIKYPEYENYDAIEVSRVNLIPKDYNGVMGVPISYLNKHNSNQFKIVGLGGYGIRDRLNGEVEYISGYDDHGGSPMINGIRKYLRVFIKNKSNQ